MRGAGAFRLRTFGRLVVGALLATATLESAPAASPPPSAAARDAQAETEAPARFDAAAATADWLARVPPDRRARSDAYVEGGYWLQLWDFLILAAVLWLLLATGVSAWMRDRAERLTGFKGVQWLAPAVYWAQFQVVASLLWFPYTVYAGFFREHQYGLSTQTFGPWLGDQAKGLLVNVVLGAMLLPILYAILRHVRAWWAWGAVASMLFVMFTWLIGPVFIFPLFNTFTRLEDRTIKEPILSLARANGIAAEDVFVVDASRQTTRISANVSGFLGTERISLNDNLLKRCSLGEIESVTGHEIGHYVLHHNYEGALFFSVLMVLGFLYLRATFERMARRFGGAWRVEGIADPAGLPLLVLLLSAFFLVAAPIINSFTRTLEAEADLFGMNAVRRPDAWAEVALKLGEYRKLDPGPLEEVLFYDHPGGRNRIFMAMRWKAENLDASASIAP